MPKFVFLFLLIFLGYSLGFAQSLESQREILIVELCNILTSAEKSSNPDRLQIKIDELLNQYFLSIPENDHEEESKNIFFRLERNCDAFQRFLDKKSPPQGDWLLEKESPISKLTKEECGEFLKNQVHYYIDPSGEIVTVKIMDGIYVESYPDGTYSKLSFHWLENCEFMLEFIESDHEVKKRLSIPGDQYFYRLIDKNEGSYIASTEIKGSTNYYSFKIYINKPVKFK